MADRFVGSLALRGANGKVSNVRYALKPSTYAEAKTALDALAGAVAVITDATISQKNLTFVYGESAAAGAGDVFEKATVAAHVNLANEVEKFAVINIPAPSIDIFLSGIGAGRDEIDIADADLQAYMSALETNAYVSDGETVNTAQGANGIKAGRRTLSAVKLG